MKPPPLDFRVGCECPACALALDLWYGDEHRHPRVTWEKFWEDWVQGDVWKMHRPCTWQLRRFGRATNAPAAYKIC